MYFLLIAFASHSPFLRFYAPILIALIGGRGWVLAGLRAAELQFHLMQKNCWQYVSAQW